MITVVRLFLIGWLLAFASAAMAAQKTAIFPFELIDDSQEGEANGVRADQTKRLQLITDELKKLVAENGRFEPVDLTPIMPQILEKQPLYKCNGCEDDLAKKVGATKALICTVQKVSNLILNINVYVRDVNAGKITREFSVDVRGNTDESWLRSVKYLAKNRLFGDQGQRNDRPTQPARRQRDRRSLDCAGRRESTRRRAADASHRILEIRFAVVAPGDNESRRPRQQGRAETRCFRGGEQSGRSHRSRLRRLRCHGIRLAMGDASAGARRNGTLLPVQFVAGRGHGAQRQSRASP